VNRYLTDELVRIVTEARSGTTALDLYAGVGLFSSVLNREFERVIAVESSPTSYADLLYNSAANVKRVRAIVEQYLENAAGKLHPDLVVVDPPRAGLGEGVIRNLVKLGAPRITYVSCDPATLSRDLRALLQSGYRVEQAHLVDLFPQTYHLESVFHLVR
jgi:23S rRNA (uracil1939-C5)-methyltransferase